MNTVKHDVTVIGTGPSGLAAALAADSNGAKTLLIENEASLGGIIKQYIYNGFYHSNYQNKNSWLDYAQNFINQIYNTSIKIMVLTYITKFKKTENGFELTLVNKEGITKIISKSIIFARGCREHISRYIEAHGRHCAGIFTTGTVQYYMNMLGKIPAKNCIIIGANEIGLITAHRLQSEGIQVLGVYEAEISKNEPKNNIRQCLESFNIPFYSGKTVTRIYGEVHLNSVEISSVDNNMTPIAGTEEKIECDALILAAGIIPENEFAESLGIPVDKITGELLTDKNYMTIYEGIFYCGSAMPVYESGEAAGRAAANWAIRY